MSIQAVAWALDQDLPARPKLVLVSIANHANHTDGYCWLRVETIAAEASCSRRAVFNFVGALIRNGFVRKEIRKGEDGKQRANDYWILLDRKAADWISAAADDADEGSTDQEETDATSSEPDAPRACGENVETAPAEPVDKPAGAPGPHAPACTPIDAEPSKTKPEESRPAGYVPRSYRPPPPPPPQPMGSVVGHKAERIFVRIGTPAYDAWAKVKAKESGIAHWRLKTSRVTNGEQQWGWYFPSLFPPSQANSGSDPPKGSLASEEELKHFGKTG